MTQPTDWSIIRAAAEILWLPLLIAALTAAVTWLIWYYTGVPCTPEAAVLHHCNPARITHYINVEIFVRCVTLGSLTGTLIGGGVNYIVISRERAARIAAETMLVEERKRTDEERTRVDEERARTDEERTRVDQLVQQFAENQRHAAENQQAILSTLAELTAELIELRRQHNGENGS